MVPSSSRLLLLAAAIGFSGCTINLNGKGTVNNDGNGGNNGGGNDQSSSQDSEDPSSDGGSTGSNLSNGIFVIDLHDDGYICDVVWDLDGTGTDCDGCDLAFDVDLTNESGSCGLGGTLSGELVWANGAVYFDGGYIGQGYNNSEVAVFYTNGYVYGAYYDYYYYGGGYLD